MDPTTMLNVYFRPNWCYIIEKYIITIMVRVAEGITKQFTSQRPEFDSSLLQTVKIGINRKPAKL